MPHSSDEYRTGGCDGGAEVEMMEAALRYLRAGLCVLPAIRAEKRPAVPRWKQFQNALPSEAQLAALFKDAESLCIVCGKVSGNLELLDFDLGGEAFEPWCEQVKRGDAGLLDRLVIERSPSGGWHVAYRCRQPVCGNLKLAQRVELVGSPDEVTIAGKRYKPRKDARGRWHVVLTTIETRGEGGLFLCSPTPGYELVQSDFDHLPVLTEAERELLLAAAYGLNQYLPEPIATPGANGDGSRPGDEFNQRGDVRGVLASHGWRLVRDGGDNEYWRRPGKSVGWSATLKDGVFYVFSSNAAPFEPNKAYSPFAVYAYLEHNGDFAAASRALRAEGYGEDDSAVDLSGLVGSAGAPPLAELPAPSPTPPPPRIKLTRADQIEMRPPHWLLRGMLERDTFALIFGDPGCGKSFLAIDWACRVATGAPWRGHAVKGGPVVYIAGEGQQGFGRRIRAWSEHHGVTLADMPLYLAPAVAIPNPTDLIALITAIDTGVATVGRPTMIVLDTLARCFGDGDENSTQDMGRFVSACDALRQRYGCTILVVHHTGHADKSRARGAIALKAALDAEYRLSNDSRMLLTATKMKDAEPPPPLALEMVPVALPDLLDDYGNPVTSAAIEVIGADTSAIESAAKARSSKRGYWQQIGIEVAYRLMAEGEAGQASVKDWHAECKKVGMCPSTRYDVLARLCEREVIVVDGDWIRAP